MNDQELEKIQKSLRKPKSKKGQRIIKDREAKEEEGPKQTLFIKGNKSSEQISEFIKDLYALKKNNSLLYSKRHDIHPFEDMSMIEKYCSKNQCNLFVFGSHQKKRPNNIVFGRMYNDSLLDMVEIGIENFKSAQSFKSQFSIPTNSRPSIIFQGEVFVTSPNHMKIKNLLLDMFVENIALPSVDLLKGLTHTIVVSGTEEKIYFNTYAVRMDQKIATKEQIKDDEQPLQLQEVGPSCELVVRRDKWATDDLFKSACKKFKAKVRKENKNVSRDNMDNVQGRVFVDKQNLDVLALHKRKKIKRGEKALQKQQQQQQANNKQEQKQAFKEMETVDI